MPLGSAAHIDFQLRHAGELVVFGTQKGYGLLDTPGQDAFDQTQFRLRGYARVLVVREGAFSGLTEDAKISHNGVDYTIRDIGSAGSDGLRRLVVTYGGPAAPLQPVDHIVITPASSFVLAVGDALQLTATIYDLLNNVLTGRALTWASSDPSIATVTVGGVVTAVAVGAVVIRATSEGVTGTAALTVVVVSALNVVFAQDYNFPNTQPAGVTFTPEGNATRWIYDAGNGQYGRVRRAVQAPSDWQTGPNGFNLVNGNGWIDGGDQGADAAHHNLHWHRFTGGATMFVFSQIMSAYNLENRDELPAHTFAGFWIKGTEGVGLTITLKPSNDGGNLHVAATKTITLHAVEQYVALEGDMPGIDNATMLSGLSLCVWIQPTAGSDATAIQNGHLDVLGCVPFFCEAPSDLLTNAKALDRFRMLKPTTAAVAQGVAIGGMAPAIHATRGLYIAEGVKNHLADPCDVGQGSQWTKTGGATVTDSGVVGPELDLANTHTGYTYKRVILPPGATLTLAAPITLEQSNSNLADANACRDTFCWVHGNLLQDGSNALPSSGDIHVEIVGTATYAAPWQKWNTDPTDRHWRGRPYVPASNNATTFGVVLRNVSTQTLTFLLARLGVEREAYNATSTNDPQSRNCGTFAMAAIQRLQTVTGWSDPPIQNLVRNRFDDAAQFADFVGGFSVAVRTWIDWDLTTLAAVRNPNYQAGRKLFDQGTYANDDTSLEVVFGETDVAGSGSTLCQVLCYPGTPLGGRRRHELTFALPATALVRGAFNDIAVIVYQNKITGLYINGTWYDSATPGASEIFQDGTLWPVTHGWYLGTDRDFAAAWNGFITAMDFVLEAGGPSRAHVEYLFTRFTRMGAGSR